MSGDPLRLDALLESVADGSDVDWDAAEAAADENQRRIVRNLRLVASIAKVHRSIPDEVSDPPGPPVGLHTGAVAPGEGQWGHLLLLETIGEGSFGDVYRARDPWLDRQVALKLLKPDIAAPARLMAEAQALARIRHPNVVTVHGADMRDGRVGLWMELVRGRTLAAIVASEGPFSAAEAAVMGQELCRAVAAVHAAGLIHRDIKAQNVMRESGGRLVLMDFGAGHTPLYAAPELTHGSEATVATDIYALGVLLYYLVVGKYPVVGSSREELKQAHVRGERRRLRDVRPDLPLAFIEAVERALEPDPGRRFASPGEMEQALTQISSGPSGQIVATQDRLDKPASIVMPRWALAAAAAAVVSALGAATWWYTRPIAPPRSDTQLIAVLPLLGPQADQEYFADGMTDALMQELATLRSVRVVSRTSVDLARRSAKTLPAIAKTLNANAILEGSVNGLGDRVRVNLRLIHAGTDTPVWARTFEQPVQSIFELQRDVARSVARELSVALTETSQTPQSVNAQAHDAYLRGRYHLRTISAASQRQALTHFQDALRRDARYAPAHAGLAQAHLILGSLGDIPRDEALGLIREAVTRALQLDNKLADAHAVFGEITFQYDWDWAGAEAAFRRALALNPSHSWARERYAMFLVARGRSADALTQIEQARQVDPLSPGVISATGSILRYARRYDEAVAQFQKALAATPGDPRAEIGLAYTLNVMGRHDEALQHYRRISGSNRATVLAEIALAEARAGRRDAALASLAQLKRNEATARWIVPPHLYAYVQGQLGQRDEAFKSLEEAFRRREGGVLWLKADPRADPLRNDPRFAEYLRRLGVDQ